MRRGPAAATAAVAALLLVGTSAEAALIEPVSVTATAPKTVSAGSQFALSVAVEAEAGALDIAAAPLTLGVKLAPECGGSLVGTPGSAVLERTLPGPTAGAAYAQTVTAQVTAPAVGTDVVCAFLQDSQERQFATDTEAEVNVVPGSGTSGATAGGATTGAGCAAATGRLKAAKRGLRRLDKRIQKVKRKLRRAHGRHHEELARKLHKLKAHRRKVLKRRRAAARTVATVCS